MLIEWGTQTDADAWNITSSCELDYEQELDILLKIECLDDLKGNALEFITYNFTEDEIRRVVEKHEDEIYKYCIENYDNAEELLSSI